MGTPLLREYLGADWVNQVLSPISGNPYSAIPSSFKTFIMRILREEIKQRAEKRNLQPHQLFVDDFQNILAESTIVFLNDCDVL